MYCICNWFTVLFLDYKAFFAQKGTVENHIMCVYDSPYLLNKEYYCEYLYDNNGLIRGFFNNLFTRYTGSIEVKVRLITLLVYFKINVDITQIRW